MGSAAGQHQTAANTSPLVSAAYNWPPFGTRIALQQDVLRITLLQNSNALTLKLEGRLVGLWIQEMRVAVLRTELRNCSFTVDISDLTFADHEGEEALLWLQRMGAQFTGDGSFSAYLCQRLQIPLMQQRVLPRTEGCGAESPAAPLPARVKRVRREQRNCRSGKAPS